MFELGFAIGSEKPVWLLRDPTIHEAERKWNQVKILTTVGFEPYVGSADIVGSFSSQRPDIDGHSIFRESIAPRLFSYVSPSLFYLASPFNTDPERTIRRSAQEIASREEMNFIVDDPSEAGLQPLAWYGQQIYSSVAVMAHFSPPRRRGSETHNARCALACGLAVGMGKPVLMLAEHNYMSPIDYRDFLHVYKNVKDSRRHTQDWLQRTVSAEKAAFTTTSRRDRELRLATELKSLRFGEHIAENEATSLSDYFVETGHYLQVLETRTTVFAGRKGAGKSANFIRATQELSEDKRNLVCVIKPLGYELEGVVRLLKQHDEKDRKTYLVEALWRFLLYTQMAIAVSREIELQPWAHGSDSPEWALLTYIQEHAEVFNSDFSLRLEAAIERVTAVGPESSIAKERDAITVALHRDVLAELRRLLGDVLAKRERVAILVDNLDKAWERAADVEYLSVFLLGLLSSITRIEADFRQTTRGRKPVPVTLAVFVRSDILSKVLSLAREPDKIPVDRLSWDDKTLLLRVVEERYMAAQGRTRPPPLWETYFEATTDRIPTQTFITSRVLPRPRDIVYFCNAAVTAAINRRHDKVRQEDIKDAEKIYSQFAFEVVLVEGGVRLEQIEEVLYEFVGEKAVLTENAVLKAIRRVHLTDSDKDVIELLRDLSFLGLETRRNTFDFSERPSERKKAETMASRLSRRTRTPRQYKVHPAFHAFLEIEN